MVSVKFSAMIAACRIPAFVHRATGDVLIISQADAEMAEKWFPGVRDLDALLATVSNSEDWLAVPTFHGRSVDLGAFVRAWCAENNFTVTED